MTASMQARAVVTCGRLSLPTRRASFGRIELNSVKQERGAEVPDKVQYSPDLEGLLSPRRRGSAA